MALVKIVSQYIGTFGHFYVETNGWIIQLVQFLNKAEQGINKQKGTRRECGQPHEGNWTAYKHAIGHFQQQ